MTDSGLAPNIDTIYLRQIVCRESKKTLKFACIEVNNDIFLSKPKKICIRNISSLVIVHSALYLHQVHGGTTEEGNCSYLLPLSNPEVVYNDCGASDGKQHNKALTGVWPISQNLRKLQKLDTLLSPKPGVALSLTLFVLSCFAEE